MKNKISLTKNNLRLSLLDRFYFNPSNDQDFGIERKIFDYITISSDFETIPSKENCLGNHPPHYTEPLLPGCSSHREAWKPFENQTVFGSVNRSNSRSPKFYNLSLYSIEIA